MESVGVRRPENKNFESTADLSKADQHPGLCHDPHDHGSQ